jgi:probable phosphoglycerate mutase
MNDRLVVHSDGGARGNPGPAGIGAVVTDPSTSPPEVVATVSESIGTATNNVAEYRALIAGVDAARRLGAREVEVRADSKLVVEQLAGRWRVKQAHLRPLHAQALELLGGFDGFELLHVPREENADADALANAAMDAAAAR